MMNTNLFDYFLPDSNITEIRIREDQVDLEIHWDVKNKPILVRCNGVVGFTNLCMWDDVIIGDNVSLKKADIEPDTFLSSIVQAYKPYSFGECFKQFPEEILDLSIELVNQITFHIYCANVWVEE